MSDHVIPMADCVGESAPFRRMMEMAATVAPRRATVVITGESGTGKEMLARYVHTQSERAQGPFVTVDCTNLRGELLASQLFGHVKGAFTGADYDTAGFFRAADEGTIFLDEIGEMSLDLQARLLRVLQEGAVTPVGSTDSHPVDVRVLCATHRDLRQMVAEGRFREDLFYRINVVSLHVCPLRERPEDILPLAQHFLDLQAELYEEPGRYLTEDARQAMLHYHWPGNVRELANAMERAYVLSPTNAVDVDYLPAVVVRPARTENLAPIPTLEQAQRQAIRQALQYTKGRKLAAARLLGVESRRLNRLIKSLGVELPAKSA